MKPTAEQAAILRAFADGKTVQAFDSRCVHANWYDCGLPDISHAFQISEIRLRIKPNTIKVVVNGKELEFPEPMREVGPEMYAASTLAGYPVPMAGAGNRHQAAEMGICHPTKEAAQQHLDVLIAISRGAA